MSISGIMLWMSIGAGILLIYSFNLASASATANAGYVDHGDTKGKRFHNINKNSATFCVSVIKFSSVIKKD